MQETINRANRTADLIRKLVELSGFCITGMVQLADSKTGIGITVHFTEK